jgi:hypothetical protein
VASFIECAKQRYCERAGAHHDDLHAHECRRNRRVWEDGVPSFVGAGPIPAARKKTHAIEDGVGMLSRN